MSAMGRERMHARWG